LIVDLRSINYFQNYFMHFVVEFWFHAEGT